MVFFLLNKKYYIWLCDTNRLTFWGCPRTPLKLHDIYGFKCSLRTSQFFYVGTCRTVPGQFFCFVHALTTLSGDLMTMASAGSYIHSGWSDDVPG